MINLPFRKENKNIAFVQFCNIKQQIETTNIFLYMSSGPKFRKFFLKELSK
jgi:hypothetical protein